MEFESDKNRLRIVQALYLSFPIALGLANLILAGLLIYWLWTLKIHQQWKKVLQLPISWALIGLYVVILVGLIYTPATSDWCSLHLGKYARLLYVIVLMCLLWGNSQAQKAALNGFCLAMLFILFSTWMNVWLILPWSETKTPGWGISHHVFGDYITQNVMMSFFAILMLHRALTVSATLHKVSCYLIFVLACISITHLSAGRTGYLMLGTALTVYFFISTQGRSLRLGAILLICTGILAFATSPVALSRLSSAIQEGQNFSSDKTSSIGHRLYNYAATPRLIAESPIIGHGTGSYHQEICRVLEPGTACSMYSWHPHNQFLFLGADHGVIGIAIFISIIVCMFIASAKSTDLDGKRLLATLAAMLLIDSLINSPLWSSRESHFFMYMMALLVCMASRKENS